MVDPWPCRLMLAAAVWIPGCGAETESQEGRLRRPVVARSDSGSTSRVVPFAVPDRYVPREEAPRHARPGKPPVEPADTTRIDDVDHVHYRYEEDKLPVLESPDTLPYQDLVLRELRSLDTGITPKEWNIRHPADSLDRFVMGSEELWDPYDPFQGPPCARALRRIPLSDSRVALRVVFFYPPPRDEGGVLPDVRDTLGLDLLECRMGALWLAAKIEAPPLWRSTPADSARILTGFESVRSALEGWLGPPDRVGPPFLPYRFWDWLDPAFWRQGETSHLVFYDDFYNDLQVGAWASLSGLPIEPATATGAVEDTAVQELRTLVEWAVLDFIRADSLLALASRAYLARRGSTPQRPVPDSLLVRHLERWLRTADTLPAPRRAAALLVADAALSLALPSVDAREVERARPFEWLGARYEHTLGASYVYWRNWLEEGYAMAVDGPVRDYAFLTLLQRAFVAFGCTHVEDAFRTVIERGERFLAQHPGSRVAPEVALEVARAHGDVVALAWEIDDVASSYVDGEPFLPEAPEARREALRYYRMALAGLEDPKLRDEAWREAWRLAAGMPPVATTHVYICD